MNGDVAVDSSWSPEQQPTQRVRLPSLVLVAGCGGRILIYTPRNNSGQVAHTCTHLPLSPSSINWYWCKLEAKQELHTTRWHCRLAALTCAWLRATETEISATLCAHVARKGL